MPRPLAAVTGASSGIGAVFARKLAERGFDLLLIARRRDRLQQLSDELALRCGAAVDSFPADLSTSDGIQEVASRIAGEQRLAMLINNAGFGAKGRFFESPIEEQERMHRVHVDATMRLTHAALGGMVRRDAGAIVNVSSVAAFARSPGNVSYCATKAWINAFTEGLYLELAGINSRVIVQALCPGFTYTEFHDTMGVDRAVIPGWLWMSADAVVSASLAGLRTRKLFVVPGWKYRLFTTLVTKFPVRTRIAMEARSPHTRNRLERGGER